MQDKILGKHIKQLLKCMDFQRIHYAMTALNWKWSRGSNLPSEVPTIDELKSEVVRQCNDCYRDAKDHREKNNPKYRGPYILSCGGFVTECYLKKKSGELDFFHVYFELTGWDTIDE